ncbi:unnamed protein product [Allacma fusca]|uniref:Fucosyltransferase n=1 Tax=Allacma fusca TaxID=39272 RepID=A0A8J2PKT1_9HEXA|nr:unnamed protein product [Allacma fusca]
MEIDSYGKCGDKTCPDDTKCREYLGNHYKFFLAFENSLCEDYVTEKFFASFPVGMVPVTYGLGNYDEIAPPHSFINALDFPNTKALAEYLLHLDKNDEEYLAYFDWRRNYAMGYNGGDIQFCTLCMKVWEPIRPKQLSDGFDAWWISKKNSTTDVNNGTLSKQILQKAKKGCVLFNKILRNNFVLT